MDADKIHEYKQSMTKQTQNNAAKHIPRLHCHRSRDSAELEPDYGCVYTAHRFNEPESIKKAETSCLHARPINKISTVASCRVVLHSLCYFFVLCFLLALLRAP